MKKFVLLASVLLFSLCAIVVTPAVAQQRIVVVDEGDWFKYEITVYGIGPYPPPEQERLEELNATEYLLLSVQDISGTNITFQVTQRFRNGTERIRGGYLDIDSGNSSEDTAETMDMTFFAVSANLDVNDTIYTSPRFSHYEIRENVNMTFPSSERETNHFYSILETMCLTWWRTDYYWDRTTGILVEHSSKEFYKDILTKSVSYRLTDSSVWIIPEFPTLTSMLLLLTILTVCIAIYKKRLLRALYGKNKPFVWQSLSTIVLRSKHKTERVVAYEKDNVKSTFRIAKGFKEK